MDEAPYEGDLLRRYLADRDATCPVCRYNLKSAAGPQCPECGHDLTLALRHPSSLWGRRALLVLVFGWLLVGGAVNGTSEGRAVYAALTDANALTTRLWTGLNLSMPSTLTFTPGATSSPGSGTVTVTTAPAAPGGVAVSGSTATFSGPITVTTAPRVISRTLVRTTGPSGGAQWVLTPAADTGWAWTNVTWPQWTALGAWTALTLVAAVGLLLTLVHRRRASSRRTSVLLMLLAWLGGAGYLAWQVGQFVVDLV